MYILIVASIQTRQLLCEVRECFASKYDYVWHFSPHTFYASHFPSIIEVICYLNIIFFPSKAFRNGIQYPRTQFILIGEYADDWLRETNPARDLGCTLEERQLTLGYALTVNLPDQPENTNTIRPFGGLVRE